MTPKEQSLKQALEASRCPELPRQLRSDETRFWVEAIVLVQKRNVQQSYAIAKRHGDGSYSIVQDFGSLSPIAGTLSIHPYLYLDEKYLYAKKSTEHKRAMLKAAYPEKAEQIGKADENTIQTMMLEYGILQQQECAKSDNILDEIAQRVAETDPNDNYLSTEDIPVANRARKSANKVK